MIFEDVKNKLKAVIFFKQSKFDKFLGKLYEYDPSKPTPSKEPTKMGDLKDIKKEICQIEGSWL